jgi:ubiquitin C-terminal hydrolase
MVTMADKQSITKRVPKSCHRITDFSISNIKMDWTLLKEHGVGLQNGSRSKNTKNICYLNAIMQCLANTPPFAQWLLEGSTHGQCK